MKTKELHDAHLIFRQFHNMTKLSRKSALERLASAGFNAYEIRSLTGVSVRHALGYTKKGGGYYKFNPQTLDAIILLAVGYEDDKTISRTLLINIVQWGTALATVARLLDIPLDKLREVVHE